MHPLRRRAQYLLYHLSESELESMWALMESHFYDLYMLKAVQDSKRSLQPGDALTREEAMRLLPLLPVPPRSR